ncbi:MAG: AI-2E family transporter [Anaerolineales bacterium]|nr:AI-2E family transporter [Anaerolineales bacterium]MDW8226683.1 AI-2E family transporter [Anaerolineales bacterium]
MNQAPVSSSPRWSALTKLVVALTSVFVLGALLLQFRGLIFPVVLAFLLAYLLYPVALFLARRVRLSWRWSVHLIYLVIFAAVISLFTAGGIGLVQQVQNLIRFIQNNIDEIPILIETWLNQRYQIGPFTLDLSTFDLAFLNEWLLPRIEPALGRLAGLVGTIASSAASTIGWTFFILVVSYFFLLESGGLRDRIIQINLPFYSEELRRLAEKLAQVWNAFLRGQMIIFVLTTIVYAIVLTILGIRYAFVLALVTGFANFLPYVGPAVNWFVLGLVAFLQDSNYFGLPPLGYTILVIAVALVIDQIFNNLVNPRVLANTLKVHPAFVLITALLGARLIGVLGVILAAPLLATFQVLSTYIMRKMLDLDPWPPETPVEKSPSSRRWRKWLLKIRSFLETLWRRVKSPS